jgi:hypothetical protein
MTSVSPTITSVRYHVPMAAPRRRHDVHAPAGEQRRSPSVALTDDPMPTVCRVAAGVSEAQIDAYFSADVETDGPIPGPYSMLSFALVYAGSFDGSAYEKPVDWRTRFRAELRPISEEFQPDALAVNRIDRERLKAQGEDPVSVMTRATDWVRQVAGGRRPILVAYPLSFDWTWLYWYFVRFSSVGSPFNHSGCYDLKTAYAVKGHRPIARSGRDQLLLELRSAREHTHDPIDDAIEQAEIFAKLYDWRSDRER